MEQYWVALPNWLKYIVVFVGLATLFIIWIIRFSRALSRTEKPESQPSPDNR
ncbi:MAG: hypothetical protein WC544_01180 [Patescibacteria group bacterium]